MPLPLPDDGRSAAFDGAARLLQADPNLRRIGALFVLPDSPAFDDPPPKDRAYIRLWPHLRPESAVGLRGGGVRIFESPIDLEITLRVPSWLWRDTPNLWGVIESRLLADDALSASGVSWVQDPIGPAELGPDQVGTGRVTLMVYIDR